MKTIVDFKKEVGGDGAIASGALVLEGGFAKARVEISYPVAKALKPATDLIDDLVGKLEKAIPGDWDKALLLPIAEEAKKKLIALLSE